MNTYTGRHAELFDFFYADKPYAAEAAFVHRCLQEHGDGPGRKLLELACGTGSHALALEKLGYDLIATDYSEPMLAVARQKADRAGSHVEFRLQDMRRLEVAERPFDAAICLFDSIGYVATNDGVQQVLRGVHDHLRPGGLFVFEFWHAAAMVRGYDPVRVRRWTVPGGELLRVSETRLNCAEQTGAVTYHLLELRDNGTFARHTETQTNRFFLVQEMAYFLTMTGLEPLKWFAGFTADETITRDTWHVVAVARRP